LCGDPGVGIPCRGQRVARITGSPEVGDRRVGARRRRSGGAEASPECDVCPRQLTAVECRPPLTLVRWLVRLALAAGHRQIAPQACQAGGPRAGSAPTASGAVPAAGAGSVRPPAGRRSRRPRPRSPPWSRGATQRLTWPGACSCHDVPSGPMSPASSPGSARRAGWKSSGRRCARASRPSRAHQLPPRRQSVVT